MFGDAFDGPFDLEKMETIVRNYTAGIYYFNQFFPTLSFAWQRQNNQDGILPVIVNSTSDAEVLVVIGYSFPYFNREIDREFIGAMANLKKVYFQAPDAAFLIDRFQSIRPDARNLDLVPITDTNQFFLPHEL